MKHGPRCNCIRCELRRDLSPAFWCSSCECWQPYADIPGAEARVKCDDCGNVQEIDVPAGE